MQQGPKSAFDQNSHFITCRGRFPNVFRSLGSLFPLRDPLALRSRVRREKVGREKIVFGLSGAIGEAFFSRGSFQDFDQRLITTLFYVVGVSTKFSIAFADHFLRRKNVRQRTKATCVCYHFLSHPQLRDRRPCREKYNVQVPPIPSPPDMTTAPAPERTRSSPPMS